MDLTFSDEEIAFREEVRAFLNAELTEDIRRAARLAPTVWVDADIALEWQAKLNAKGWLAYFWPKEYGGTGWTPTQRYIFEVECVRAGAPTLIPMGLKYVGPVIFTFGSEAQKSYYLPRILSGEDYWCQGYSEPGAGSDLAALQCKAERDGDHYVVNGSKMWTTHAQFSNMIFCLVRTSKEDRPQKGISFLLIDLNAPGVSVTPIITLAGDHEVNQVFFEDVRVPAENLVGEEGAGWTYSKFLLEYERGGTMFACRMQSDLEELETILKSEPDGYGASLYDDPAIRAQLADFEAEIKALEVTEIRNLYGDEGVCAYPDAMPSLIKTISSELGQKISAFAVSALGPNALPYVPLESPYFLKPNDYPAPDHAMSVVSRRLNGLASTIFGGASEVQRDIIAKVVLS